jgi:hypothetical protein
MVLYIRQTHRRRAFNLDAGPEFLGYARKDIKIKLAF